MATSYAAAGSPADAALRSRAPPIAAGRPSLAGGCAAGTDWRFGRISVALRATAPVASFFGAGAVRAGGLRRGGFSTGGGPSLLLSNMFNGSGAAGSGFVVGHAGVKLGKVGAASRFAIASPSGNLGVSVLSTAMLAVVSFSGLLFASV